MQPYDPKTTTVKNPDENFLLCLENHFIVVIVIAPLSKPLLPGSIDKPKLTAMAGVCSYKAVKGVKQSLKKEERSL